MPKMIEGAEALTRKLQAMRDAAAPVLRPALIKAGEEIAADMRALAQSSKRTGDLIESVHVTGPGQTTPPHATEGGQRTAGPFEVLVTAGDSEARHAHLVEGGTKPRMRRDGSTTGTMPAAPFFNPAWRLNRKRLEQRINRLLRKALREAGQ